MANGGSSVVTASQHMACETEAAEKTLLTSVLSRLAIWLCHFYRRREGGQGASRAGWSQPQDNLWMITFSVYKGPAQERKVTQTNQEVLWVETPHFMFASFANVFKLKKKKGSMQAITIREILLSQDTHSDCVNIWDTGGFFFLPYSELLKILPM